MSAFLSSVTVSGIADELFRFFFERQVLTNLMTQAVARTNLANEEPIRQMELEPVPPLSTRGEEGL